MTRTERLRRVIQVCCIFAQNLAYYRAGWDKRRPLRTTQFWVTANGNFLDSCVLEWCKLFGDKKGDHYWGKITSDPAMFESELLHRLGISAQDFGRQLGKVRHYRDKFVAHLDSEDIMNIPDLEVAKKSVWFYHAHVMAKEAVRSPLGILPEWSYDLDMLYRRCAEEASREYGGYVLSAQA
jgi:hypothetical protein